MIRSFLNHLIKIIIIIIIFNLIFIFFPHKANSEIMTITVGGDNNFPPYEYIDENGQYKGFNVDIMNAIAIEMGLQIEFVPLPWNEAIEALNNGQVDALQGMTYNDERSKLYDFTDTLVNNTQCIFVLKDNYYVHSLDDLSEKKS